MSLVEDFQLLLANHGVWLLALVVLALAPRRCLALAGSPETRRRLEGAGCEVLVYEGQEISNKGDGGPTCLTRPLVRG